MRTDLRTLRNIIRAALNESGMVRIDEHLLLEGMTVGEFEKELQDQGHSGDLAHELKTVQDKIKTRAGTEVKNYTQEFFSNLEDKSWFRKQPTDDNLFAWWLTTYRRAVASGNAWNTSEVVDQLDAFLGGLDVSTTGEKRKALLEEETIVERLTKVVDGVHKEIEILVPLSHPSAVMCSARVGGSTWCNTSRGNDKSFNEYTEGFKVFFIIHQISPKVGKPEPMQISGKIDKKTMEWKNIAEIETASQNRKVGLRDAQAALGIELADLMRIYAKHKERISNFLIDTEKRIIAMREAEVYEFENEHVTKEILQKDGGAEYNMGDVIGRTFTSCTFEPAAFNDLFQFHDCRFINCNMNGLDVKSALWECFFINCEMKNAKMQWGEISFKECDLEGASFQPSAGKITNLTIMNCKVGKTDFKGAQLKNCRLFGNIAVSEPAFINISGADEKTMTASPDINFKSAAQNVIESRRWLELAGLGLLLKD